MTVLIRTRGLTRRSVKPARIKVAAERMLGALALPEAELSILLCGDPTIQDLNAAHRDLDRPTDVLAFPQTEPTGRDPDATPTLLGDVVISLDTARRQAADRGHTQEHEVIALLAHGLLHLLGLDHQNQAAEEHMANRAQGLIEAARGC